MNLGGLLRSTLLGAALLAGCATLPQGNRQQAEQNWAAHRQDISAIDAFDLQARIAGSALGAKADVLWQQAADGSYRIRVSGPFGAGGMSLRGDAHQVEVTTGEGTFTTANPEDWLRQRMGWTLPLAGLRWWALGLPAPHGPAHVELDDSGKIVVLEQDGWRLTYDSYAAAGRWQLPRRFDAGNGTVSLRVLADQWTPHTAAGAAE